ncbi:MAG: phosphate ABC transporter permease PstA [Verrucomicrobiota bacterium]
MRTANSIKVADRLLHVTSGVLAGLAVLGLGAIVVQLFRDGASELGTFSLNFLVGEVEDAGRAGGIGPILASTGLILLIALGTSLPLGIASSIWLSEFASATKFRATLVSGIDLLASVPSIVFGLFGMVFFCEVLGLGFSLAAGGLTLGLMILPLVIRTTSIGLEGLPRDLRGSAAALGLSKVSLISRLLLPQAAPSIAVGAALGTGRALAETAALIFTSGYATRWPSGIDQSGRALSVHVYDLAMNVPRGTENAAKSALVLLILVLVINLLTQHLSKRWRRSLSKS